MSEDGPVRGPRKDRSGTKRPEVAQLPSRNITGIPEHDFPKELRALAADAEAQARRAGVMEQRRRFLFRSDKKFEEGQLDETMRGRSVRPVEFARYSSGKVAPLPGRVMQIARDYGMSEADAEAFITRGRDYYRDCVQQLREVAKAPAVVSEALPIGNAIPQTLCEVPPEGTVVEKKPRKPKEYPPSALVDVLRPMFARRRRRERHIEVTAPRHAQEELKPGFFQPLGEEAIQLIRGGRPLSNRRSMAKDCDMLGRILHAIHATDEERVEAWKAFIATALERGANADQLRADMEEADVPHEIIRFVPDAPEVPQVPPIGVWRAGRGGAPGR